MNTVEAVARARVKGRWANVGLHESETDAEVRALAGEDVIYAVVITNGLPPLQPHTPDLEVFANYIHDLAVWTHAAKEQLFRLWAIDLEEYEGNLIFRRGFDECLSKWYALSKYDDIELDAEWEESDG